MKRLVFLGFITSLVGYAFAAQSSWAVGLNQNQINWVVATQNVFNLHGDTYSETLADGIRMGHPDTSVTIQPIVGDTARCQNLFDDIQDKIKRCDSYKKTLQGCEKSITGDIITKTTDYPGPNECLGSFRVYSECQSQLAQMSRDYTSSCN